MLKGINITSETEPKAGESWKSLFVAPLPPLDNGSCVPKGKARCHLEPDQSRAPVRSERH